MKEVRIIIQKCNNKNAIQNSNVNRVIFEKLLKEIEVFAKLRENRAK